MHLSILNCLQLKITLMPKWHILGWSILIPFKAMEQGGDRSSLHIGVAWLLAQYLFTALFPCSAWASQEQTHAPHPLFPGPATASPGPAFPRAWGFPEKTVTSAGSEGAWVSPVRFLPNPSDHSKAQAVAAGSLGVFQSLALLPNNC